MEEFIKDNKTEIDFDESQFGLNEEDQEKEIEQPKEQPKKKNYSSIDLLKFIMAICVVAIHAKPLIGLLDGNFFEKLILNAFEIVTSMAVPLFFMASAFFLFEKMKKAGNGDIRSSESLNVLKKYFLRMLYVYLIWALVVYMPMNIHIFVTGGTEGLSITKFIFRLIINLIVLGGGISWVGTALWYVLASFYVGLFIWLFLKTKIKINVMLILMIAVFFLYEAIKIILTVVAEKNGFSGIFETINFFIVSCKIFDAFLYFAFAYIICFYKLVDVKWWICLTVMLIGLGILFAVQNFAYGNIAILFVSPIFHLALFLCVLKIKLPESKAFIYLRKQSTVIYFVHMMFIFFVTNVFKIDLGFECFLITVLASIATASVIIPLMETKAFKWLKFVF